MQGLLHCSKGHTGRWEQGSCVLKAAWAGPLAEALVSVAWNTHQLLGSQLTYSGWPLLSYSLLWDSVLLWLLVLQIVSS